MASKKTKRIENLELEVKLVPEHSTGIYQFEKTHINISLPLLEGTHVLSTPFVSIGALSGSSDSSIIANLTIWYGFNSEANVLTICSSDLESEDALSMSFGIKGQSIEEFGKVYSSGFFQAPNGSNSAFFLGSPSLKEVVQKSLRHTNELLFEKAQEMGLTIQMRTPPPQLEQEEFEKLLMVYHKGHFVEFHDPEKEYGEEYSIHNILSTWGGEVTFAATDNFANVIGSTGDKRIAGLSWLQLWQKQFGQAQTCASLYYQNFPCSGWLVGGHVLLGKVATNVPHGANYVYIIPICTSHNNNDNVYMAPVMINKGVWLVNYHNP